MKQPEIRMDNVKCNDKVNKIVNESEESCYITFSLQILGDLSIPP